MISKKFIKNSMLYTLAGTLPMASAIILLPFYIHYLPTEVFGTLSIYLAFSMLVQIIVTYSLDTSIYLYFHEFKREPDKLSVFVSSAFVFIILFGVVVAGITTLLGSWLFEKVFTNQSIEFYPYGLISVGTAIFQAVFKVYTSLLQSREKPVVYFWSNIISFSLIAGLTILGLELFPGSLIGPIGGRMIAVVISAAWALTMTFREFGFHFDYPLLKSSFGYNRSSFIYQLQVWSMNYLDRVLLVFFVAMSDVGVYDFAMKCMLVIDFVIGGLYNSFYPKVIGVVMAQDKKQTTIEINRYYHGLTGVVMLLVCLSVPAFLILADSGIIKSGYEASGQYLPLIGVTYLFRSVRYYFVLPYGALKYSKPLPWIYLGISLLKISLLLILGKQYGVYSVIFATMGSTLLEIFLLWKCVESQFYFKMNLLKLIVAPALLAVSMLVTFFVIGHATYFSQLAFLGLCVLLLWWLYRNELRQIKFSKYFDSGQKV